MTGVRRRRSCAWILIVATLLVVPGCAGKKKKKSQPDELLSAGATFDRAIDLLSRHQLRQAASHLKRIQFAPESREELEPLTRLALADATYYQGTSLGWIDARNLYLDFVTLNGDHPLAPYAQLQVGRCSLNQVNQPSKDQSLTQQAIRDLDAVERRWPDSVYVDAARAMLGEARANLAESEFLVGRFYLKRKNFPGAIDRFNGIVIRFPDYAGFEKVLFHLAQAYVGSGSEAEARLYLDRLLTKYPNGRYVPRAQKMLGSIASGFEGEVGSTSE
jgi:outer membrane protein assembly factor BamD